MLHHCYDLNQSPHDTNGVEKKEGIGLSLRQCLVKLHLGACEMKVSNIDMDFPPLHFTLF